MIPRWKEAILTWLGVNATAFVLTFTLNPLIADWPWFPAFLAFNTAMVAGLTWWVMPALFRHSRAWLDPSQGDAVHEHGQLDPAQRQDHHE